LPTSSCPCSPHWPSTSGSAASVSRITGVTYVYHHTWLNSILNSDFCSIFWFVCFCFCFVFNCLFFYSRIPSWIYYI
jgi:hypothetical protein